MGIGHLAASFALRSRSPRVPLVLDSAPFTHSLLACVGWGALAAAAWGLARRDRAGALVLGALVVSHWVLDWVSHVPEMPLLPSGPLVGLGLWRSRWGSLAVEVGMVCIGLALYVRATSAEDRVGTIGIAVVALFLTAMGFATFLGPPPPSVTPLAVGNVVLVLLLLPVEWVDRHRPLSVPVVRGVEPRRR